MVLTDRVKRFFGKKKSATEAASIPLKIVPRDEHSVSRSQISDAALKVLYRLNNAGYEAYLVGGGVRDTLLGLNPKDFDVATNATPEQVNNLFRNSRLIGRRFKLVHVVFGREVIEVATFRAPHSDADSPKQASQGEQGMILRDNVYGNKDEDALRRDFTVNALYYSVADFTVHAYAGGWDDLQARRLRMIGDPETRYREDPVRMLRAVRFAAKLGFTLEKATEAPIRELAPLLEQIPPARLFEEVLKLILNGEAVSTLNLLRDYRLFHALFPMAAQAMDQDEYALKLVTNTMTNTDARIRAGKSVTPYFFLAALLWPRVRELQAELEANGEPAYPAMQQAADRALAHQIRTTAIPKRLSIPMREIWELQLRLLKTRSRRTKELLGHPRFRAAYDFLLLRNESGEDLAEYCEFWTQMQEQYPVEPRRERPSSDDHPSDDRAPKRRRPRRNNSNRRR